VTIFVFHKFPLLSALLLPYAVPVYRTAGWTMDTPALHRLLSRTWLDPQVMCYCTLSWLSVLPLGKGGSSE